MTVGDQQYIEKLLVVGGFIQSPCLEPGVGYEGATNRSRLKAAGIDYFGTDLAPAPNVDFALDFEDTAAVAAVKAEGKQFKTILVLNVLEHTFDPIRVLDNVISLLVPGGTCVAVTPAVWPLHNFPSDCWRINPDFYEQYARRRGLRLDESTFEYVGRGKIRSMRGEDGATSYPKPWRHSAGLWSRVIHKVFNTAGRGMFFPSHVAIGAVFFNPEAER